MNRSRTQHVAAAIVAVLLALAGLAVALTGGDDTSPGPDTPQPTPAIPAAVAVDGPDRNLKPDTVLQLDREAREVARNATTTPERHDLSPRGELRGQDTTRTVNPNTVGPLATPSFPGCRTRMLPANVSRRVTGVRAIGWHYTAGLNRPGLSDMNGLTAYASSPAAGVSWHFLIDAEGHCYYSVPLSLKAWTIGNLNSQTVNIEVIQTGRERTYPAGSAGAKKVRQVALRLHRIYGLPVRVGSVSNCNVTRSGSITHWMGGACAGNHGDIRPYSLAALVASWRRAVKPPPSKKAIAKCKTLTRVRRLEAKHPPGPAPTASQRRTAQAYKRQLAGDYRCRTVRGRMALDRR